jgi:hypothetical protein
MWQSTACGESWRPVAAISVKAAKAESSAAASVAALVSAVGVSAGLGVAKMAARKLCGMQMAVL